MSNASPFKRTLQGYEIMHMIRKGQVHGVENRSVLFLCFHRYLDRLTNLNRHDFFND